MDPAHPPSELPRRRPRWTFSLDHRNGEPGETLWATTGDGVRLAVQHVGPRSTAARGTVVLVHGLAANRLTFHYPGRSLAVYLAERGWSCFVPDLRGGGRSNRPRSWDLDTYLEQDLPAILDVVADHSPPGTRPYAIGHSMGGVLWLAFAIAGGAGRLQSVAALGSALDYRHGGSDFEKIWRLRSVVGRLPGIPWGTWMRALAPWAGTIRTPVESFNVWPSNIERDVLRRVLFNGFERIPTELLLALGSALEPAGLRGSRSGRRFLEEAPGLQLPVLLVAGSRDVQCPLASVYRTAELLPRARVATVGRDHGQVDEYGHFDLVLGSRARAEVWPILAEWLSTSP